MLFRNCFHQTKEKVEPQNMSTVVEEIANKDDLMMQFNCPDEKGL